MRLPRRVPWASKAELAQVYDLVFSPAANDESRRAALSRMSIYISCPSCPAFLHLLHSLIGALLIPYPPTSAIETGVARMSYAMAVVRFVNGMVDPLQTGTYARPISHLAATLGLPASLVALRHRATHEDLPSLPLLRRALEQSVEYIHRNSFLPLLASSSTGIWDRRARTESLVTKWKKVQKNRVRARDVSKENESGRALRHLLREVEGEDVEEILEAVVRIGLVPVGRKKRSHKNATAPTQESLLVWTPLLSHLEATTPEVPLMLVQHILDVLGDTAPRSEPETDDERRKEVASYRWTLGTWLLHLWERIPEEEKSGVLRRLARELVNDDEVLRRIYAPLAGEEVSLQAMDEFLLPDENDELTGLEEEEEMEVDVDTSLVAMEANLRALEQKIATRPLSAPARASEEVVPGWQRADNWRPCPIGIWA